MELTVREVAALLGRSPRTVRAQVARGDIPAVKRGGQWRVARRSLPLTEAQRAALQTKADAIRQAVDDALPSRLARTAGDRRRSVADLDGFRLGVALLRTVRGAEPDTVPEALRQRVTQDLEEALVALAVAVHIYDRDAKLAAIRRARELLGGVVGRLLVASDPPLAEPVADWLAAGPRPAHRRLH